MATDKTASRMKAIGTLVIIALILMIIIVDAKRRSAEKQLQQVTVDEQDADTSNQQQENQAKAKEVVEKVRKLIALPADLQPTVALIVDVNALRQRNAFYNKAENGDYLVITTDRAILYSPSKNVILDIVPVQITSAPEPKK